MDFKELLERNNFILLDGGMGTMLQARGLKPGDTPEALNLESPQMLIDIHKEYIAAGADIVYANTFGANRHKLERCGYSVERVIRAGILNAKRAVAESANPNALVALDIGPIGQLLEPTGMLRFEEAYEIFKEEIAAGSEADVIVFETMTDLYELKAAVLAAKENSALPMICTMTFEENMRTFTGCAISSMALTLEGLGVDAVGVNCSLGPAELYPIAEELCRWTNLPVVLKPNAGLPDPLTGEYNVEPRQFAGFVERLVPLGARIFGGCCGTSPDYIRELREMLNKHEFKKITREIPAACCSASKTVVIDRPRIIGERINPTGKKRFKEALLAGDIDYILGQAIEQTQGGADILDVNVGLPGIDESAMMTRAVKAIQGVADAPLQLDSTIPEVLEKALRVYNGKAVVNSVNGEEKSLQSVLPLVKKYGACVVGLCLDENGIPNTAEGRFAIAKRILNSALALGIPRENVFIDCLTLTVSAEQSAAPVTLEAVRRVKTELGLRTVLGVSNISFGLPERVIVTHNFLTMALTNGLDLPIINPNVPDMVGAVRAFNVLAGYDKNSLEYVAAYGGEKSPQAAPANAHEEITLEYAIATGLKAEGARLAEEMLKTAAPMTIINGTLIPALDKTGADFESGKIFLPQLILSAGVAQACFEVIKNHLAKSGEKSVSKGKIILATVRGDIHDIGKNIVKVLLENYGYDVIDLGRDVPYELVVDTARERNVRLVGLSALMTTTLGSMEKTISLLREAKLDCKVMVGGAVLTPEYAKQIGADFYAKDAKESCDIARQVFGD